MPKHTVPNEDPVFDMSKRRQMLKREDNNNIKSQFFFPPSPQTPFLSKEKQKGCRNTIAMQWVSWIVSSPERSVVYADANCRHMCDKS